MKKILIVVINMKIKFSKNQLRKNVNNNSNKTKKKIKKKLKNKKYK